MADEYQLTDAGNAERLVADHGRDLHYCHAYRHWLVWDDARWSRDERNQVEALAKATIRNRLEAAVKMDDSKERTALVRFLLQSENLPRIRAMIELARSEPGVAVTPDELDCEPMELNVLNGTVDLRTGQLRPHRREDLLTKLAAVVFDPEALCPLWESVIERAFASRADLVSYFRRWAGYCATGDTGEHVFQLGYGLGANSKSTIVRQLQNALGEYAVQVDSSVLLENRRDGASATPGLARLKGARLVVATEVPEGRRLDEVLIKQLTGQDRITARRLYQDEIEFDPQCKLVLIGNHKPNISGTDHGIWRRVHLLPFVVTIPPEDRDAGLAAKLDTESSGVLAWIVRGCREWLSLGLSAPAEVAEATARYRDEMDVLKAFLDERCIIGKEFRTGAGKLYEAYEEWCRDNGERAVSQRKLGQKLEERGFAAGRSGVAGRYRTGLGLLVNSDVSDALDPYSGNSLSRGGVKKVSGNGVNASLATQTEALV